MFLAGDSNKKAARPPYPSYTSFRNYIKKLGDTVVPDEIDRSVFGSQSGSYISLMIATFEWFKLIDRAGKPQPSLYELVQASDAEYPDKLKVLLLNSYEILREEKIDLQRGTEKQISTMFRAYGLNGSTLTKAITFFINACREAGYKIGDHMKAPAPPRNSTASKTKKAKVDKGNKSDGGEVDHDKDNVGLGGITVIPIPLHGMEDGAIHLPSDLNKKQWDYATKMAGFILENYHQDFQDEENDN